MTDFGPAGQPGTLLAEGAAQFGIFATVRGADAELLRHHQYQCPLTTGIYGTYLGGEKWKKDDLFNGVMVADTVAHIGVLLISGAIILVGAIVLFPQGISINTPTQLADVNAQYGTGGRNTYGCAVGGGFRSAAGEYSAVGMCCSIPASINLPRWRVKRSSGDPWWCWWWRG
jgi:hypothetical protein